MPLLLSSAYAPPIQYFAKLVADPLGIAYIELCETYVKQSYRNRCHILGPNGIQPLSIPVQHEGRERSLITDIRLSDHSDWRHQHCQAMMTAYGASPYFEYYWDDVHEVLTRPYDYLWELNWTLTTRLIELLHLDLELRPTTAFTPIEPCAPDDWRYRIRPRRPEPDPTFRPRPYYQPYSSRHGFVSGLSIVDLVFNMGPESILLLRDSTLSV